MTDTPAVREGVWRHHKGHLYWVFRTAHLTHAGHGGLVVMHAQWAGNDPYGGCEMHVEALPWPEDPARVRLLAHPAEGTSWGAADRFGVVYMGMTLAGTPKPGLRPRVRGLGEFTDTVERDGRRVPRFEYLAREWEHGLGGD